MAQPAPKDFFAWNNSHPLVIPTNSLSIPQVSFKFFLKYDGSGKMPYEHCQDVSLLAPSFDINDETIMIRLLSHSFEGKVVEWFKTLTSQSINTWEELCQALIKIFFEDGDDSTFMSLIACIKRYPHESVDDFNLIFEKNWKSIPTRIRSKNAQALVYYRKAFLQYLNVLIVMLSDTFPDVYQTTKIIEHTLVSSSKI